MLKMKTGANSVSKHWFCNHQSELSRNIARVNITLNSLESFSTQTHAWVVSKYWSCKQSLARTETFNFVWLEDRFFSHSWVQKDRTPFNRLTRHTTNDQNSKSTGHARTLTKTNTDTCYFTFAHSGATRGRGHKKVVGRLKLARNRQKGKPRKITNQ